MIKVAGDLEVVDAVERCASIEGLMNRVFPDVRLLNVTDHMEMDGVSTKHERLSNVRELTVLNSADDRLIAWRVQHDLSTVLIGK